MLKSIDPTKEDPIHISWDLGRRCNLDCSYCPSHRHDNVSPHASLEELQKTANFLFQYIMTIIPYRTSKYISLGLTGGEPTSNPHFMDFAKWMREEHSKKYKADFSISINVTTNGLLGKKQRESLAKYYDYVTISYHAESTPQQKKLVLDTIDYLREQDVLMKINIMFHGESEKFDECKKLSRDLYNKKIEIIPRMIGEHGDDNKYHHKYTREQLKWMSDYWESQKKGTLDTFFNGIPVFVKIKNYFKRKVKKEQPLQADVKVKTNPEEKKDARSLGRPCCGGREFKTTDKDGNSETTKFLKYKNFMGWYCSVNWFFLHIEQQAGLVYYHQTCQADFGGNRGAIANLNDTDTFLNKLKKEISSGSLPIIRCPNKVCGCGLCTPKAEDIKDFKSIVKRHVQEDVFA